MTNFHRRSSRRLFGGCLIALIVAGADERSDANAADAPDRAACGDFLAEQGLRPAHLRFVTCEVTDVHGARALRANYAVAGAYAAGVEASLVAEVHMPPLRRLCCGWESMPKDPARTRIDGILARSDLACTVSMASGETPVVRRDEWDRIEAFFVHVTCVTE